MPDYSKGKIYQIISPNHSVPYIGSTTQPLSKRMSVHTSPKNGSRCKSCIIIEAGGAYIELIEEFPCENKEQLNRREGEVIRARECVNRRVEGRTRNEYYHDNHTVILRKAKAYYETKKEANKDAIARRTKAYYETNKEAIATKAKAYYETNKEAIALKAKAYREANREKIRQRQAVWYQARKKVPVE